MKYGQLARTFDVRPLIAAGTEPFAHIMEAISQLEPGEGLRLLAPFKPAPLIQVMQRKGFSASLSTLDDGTWEVLFSPNADTPSGSDIADWPEPTSFVDCTGHTLQDTDSTISDELEALGKGQVLFALLPARPVGLIESFEAQGVRWTGRWDDIASGYAIMVQRG